MKGLNTKENFINVLVDCNGYSEEDAKELAEDYHNSLTDYITNNGGGNEAIKECAEFCGVKY